jgi:hypothetical protein
VYADFGVSGSISPTLWFLSKGNLSDKQSGLSAQVVPVGLVTLRTNVLLKVSFDHK